MRTEFGKEIPAVKRPVGAPRSRCNDDINIGFKGEHGRTWTRFTWLRIGASVGLM
jgi:hypothetical protein